MYVQKEKNEMAYQAWAITELKNSKYLLKDTT